jgi:hypothetical protein
MAESGDAESVKPNPKKKKVKLSPLDYHNLREKVYGDQRGICEGCGRWFHFSEWSLHHYDRKLGDVRSNVDGYCLGCHPD